MDKDTILFSNGRVGIAFNYTYYRNNFTDFSPVIRKHLSESTKIFYKMGDNVNTWIDYKRAIQLKTGTYQERLNAALSDRSFVVFDLTLLPETEYYDELGYKHNIAPYDGSYNSAFWVTRTVFNLEAIQTEFIENDLKVTFAPEDDIRNALISLNTFFYEFDIINPHTVLFRNIKSYLSSTPIMEGNGFIFKIDPYAWNGLTKRPSVTPTMRELEWYYLDYPIEENSIIIYKGVVYDYILDYENKRRFRLKNVDLGILEAFEIDKIEVHEFIATDANREARKYISNGISNRYRNCVEFALPILDGIVLFNGVDNEFEVVDSTAIVYPQTLFAVNHVTSLSFINLINFTWGM